MPQLDKARRRSNSRAFLLGYANQSAFSAAFKRTTGQAPREMRAAG